MARYAQRSGAGFIDAAAVTVGGTANAGQILALNASGYVDTTAIPPLTGLDFVSAYPTESIAQGAPVNLYSGTINSAMALCARNADSATASAGKKMHGYAATALTSSTTATSPIYRSGQTSGLSSLTIGAEYCLGPAGTYVLATSTTIVSPVSGTTVQSAGTAISATAIDILIGPAIAIQ